MPAAANKSKIPNQNDLFEIFKVQVTTIAAVNDVIVKAKVNKNVTDNIRQAANVLMDSTAAIYTAIEKSAKFNTKNAEATMNAVVATTKAISAITGSIDQILAIKNSRIRSARRGVGKLAKFLFGKDKKGLLGNQIGLFTLMETAGDEKYAKVISGGTKNLKSISESIKTLNGTLVIIGVSLIPLTLALLSVWVISKIVNVVVGMFRYVSKYDKSIGKGAKTLNTIAKAVMLIGAAALIMALTGLLIITAWPAMLASMAFVALLVGIFVVIGLSAKFINKGGKELLYIAATVAILALTATLMALVGQFITTNWDSFLITMAFMGGLILAFVMVGLAAKFINKGSKELLFIALTVGILALIAVALVWVGGLINDNWESIGCISIMLFGLVGLFIGIGVAGKMIEKSKVAFLMIMIYTIILAAVTYVFVDCAKQLKQLGAKEEFDHLMLIMGAMVLGIAGIAIGLGALTLTGFGAAALWAGVGAMGAIAGIILVLGIAMKEMVTAVKLTSEIKGDKDELIAKMSIPVDIAMGLIEKVMEVPPFILPIAASRVYSLASIVRNIGVMADTLQHIASLNIPVSWDKNGKPKEFIKMTGEDFRNAAINASGILGMAAGMFRDGEEPVKYKFSDGTEAETQSISMASIEKIGWGMKWKIRRLSKIVGYIGNMADTLQHIASLNMPNGEYDKDGKPKGYVKMTGADFMEAALNAGAILHFFTALFGDEDTQIETTDSTVIISPISMESLDKMSLGLKWKIQRLGTIVNVIGGMADTLQHISSLTMPDPDTEFNENGKPKKWKLMTGEDFMNAALNASSLLHFFVALFDEQDTQIETSEGIYTISPISMDALDNISRSTRRKVERLGDIVKVVGGIAQTLQSMAMLVVPDAQGPEDFNENGTPKKWRKMTGQDLQDAAFVAGSMLQFFCALFGEEPATLSIGNAGAVRVNPISENFLDNISRSTKKKIERLGPIVAVVGGMGETLKNLASLIVPDANGPEDFNENGTPKKWRKMTEQDFRGAMKMAEKILTNVVNILGDEAMQNKLSDMSKRNTEKLGNCMSAIQGLSGIMDLVKALAGGRMASKWKRDTNPDSPTYGQEIVVEYTNLAEYMDKNQWKINRTVRKLIMCPIEAISAISESDSDMEAVHKALANAEIIMMTVNKVQGPVTKIIDLYNEKLSTLDPGKIKPLYESVILSFVSPFAQFDETKMSAAKTGSLVIFERVAQTMSKVKIDDKSAKNYQTNVKETVGLIKQVNSVDLNKLKTADRLMAHIAELSKSINGNFEGLAKIISEDLLEALNKLTGALDGTSTIKTSTPGDVIATPSGSAGVNKGKEKQQPQKNNQPQVSPADIAAIKRSLVDIATKLNSVINGNNAVNIQERI